MRTIRYVACFLAGIVFAAVLLVSTDNLPRAWAYSNCIKTDLDAKYTNGDIPDTTFTLVYQVPDCMVSNGYTINNTYVYTNKMVAVVYQKD